MCGRFYVDDETAKEIQRLVRTTEDKIQQAEREADVQLQAGDIHPADRAPVLVAGKSGTGIGCEWQRWGFQGRTLAGASKGGTLLFNARCETALERPMFKEDVRHHRVVIPAAGFYEWNRQKEKHTFTGKARKVLFMAGFYKLTEKGKCFVILTTQANASMEPVHDRMPLILEESEVYDWIYRENMTEELLQKVPGELACRAEYRQMGLFD